MSTGSVLFSLGSMVGGAFLAAKGIVNYCKGHTTLGKYQALFGASALAWGAYSWSMMHEEQSTPQISPSLNCSQTCCESSTLEQIQDACAKVLTKGYDQIPGLDLSEHVESVGANLNGRTYRCDPKLSPKGIAFLAERGLENTKLFFQAALSNCCCIWGVIRNY